MCAALTLHYRATNFTTQRRSEAIMATQNSFFKKSASKYFY